MESATPIANVLVKLGRYAIITKAAPNQLGEIVAGGGITLSHA